MLFALGMSNRIVTEAAASRAPEELGEQVAEQCVRKWIKTIRALCAELQNIDIPSSVAVRVLKQRLTEDQDSTSMLKKLKVIRIWGRPLQTLSARRDAFEQRDVIRTQQQFTDVMQDLEIAEPFNFQSVMDTFSDVDRNNVWLYIQRLNLLAWNEYQSSIGEAIDNSFSDIRNSIVSSTKEESKSTTSGPALNGFMQSMMQMMSASGEGSGGGDGDGSDDKSEPSIGVEQLMSNMPKLLALGSDVIKSISQSANMEHLTSLSDEEIKTMTDNPNDMLKRVLQPSFVQELMVNPSVRELATAVAASLHQSPAETKDTK